MADNTEEDSISKPANTQSGNPSEEIIPTKDTETIDPNLESKNMEVHHHAHDPAAPHHKKNWKSYFWEFLMLFLAVFCGFQAEGIREHNVERHREKEYIHSLLQDLRQDSSRFKSVLTTNEKTLRNIDTSIVLLNSPVITERISRTLYASHRSNPFFLTMIYNQRTIAQLKSAGGFRLVTNQAVSDETVRYNDISEFGGWLRQELLAALKDDRGSGYTIFNDFLIKNLNDSLIATSGKQFPLMTTDKSFLISYANKLKMRYEWLLSYNGNIKSQQAKCNRLIELIKKEYHLENE